MAILCVATPLTLKITYYENTCLRTLCKYNFAKRLFVLWLSICYKLQPANSLVLFFLTFVLLPRNNQLESVY